MSTLAQSRRYYKHEALVRYSRHLGYGEVHTYSDTKTGLTAIVAIHSTKLGPAIGGCRCHPYHTTGAAYKDALQLGYMMTLKAAVSGLPHGGAKTVISKPPHIDDRSDYFRAFGDFIHQLNGRYITAIDVGTRIEDMNHIAERTPYVVGASKREHEDNNPSPYTAIGTFRGIQAAVKYKLKRDSLDGVHVAVQGAGTVAYHLTKMLTENGAQVTACDIHPEPLQKMITDFGVNTTSVDKIYDVDCDVFSPCALGGVINLDTLNRLKAKIVAGCANNQLAHRKYTRTMLKKDILYAPDFVINSGGLIHAAMLYDYGDSNMALQQIDTLYDTLLEIFTRSDTEKHTTTHIAESLAYERLEKGNP